MRLTHGGIWEHGCTSWDSNLLSTEQALASEEQQHDPPHHIQCTIRYIHISWTLLLVLGYLFYLLLGAMVFQLLEKLAESHFRDQFQLEKLKFLQNYTCLDRQVLEQFVQVVQTLAVATFLTTGTLLFLVFPPLVFSYVEVWSYGKGFYFTFITLSTTGFGNYIVGHKEGTNPNKHYISLYRSLTAIWIVFGLAWLALVFNMGADLMEKFLQLKWHEPDLSLTEGATTKMEDEPEHPRIHILS